MSETTITMLKRIALLGATGSIGDSTLSVIAQNPDKYQIVGLSGYTRLDKLFNLCLQFFPKWVSVPDSASIDFQQKLINAKIDCQVLSGHQGLNELATMPEVDVVVAAIVGSAGLSSTLSATEAGKTVLLANKEALVMAGDLMMAKVAQSGATLLPIDSEHNAIFQCLPRAIQQQRSLIHQEQQGVKKIWLTASGGPFLNKSLAEMQQASISEAIKHPNWSMGKKISIDSATMMNKGLELIEASFLFDLPVSNIEVVMHPQSIIHSMVEYVDGSFLAQLGSPDMRTPIAYALAYPERVTSGVKSLDLFSLGQLTFLPPDLKKFKCLQLAYEAMQLGNYMTIALNASNEVSVEAFLQEKIRLTDIANINENVMEKTAHYHIQNLEDILYIDNQARILAHEEVKKCQLF